MSVMKKYAIEKTLTATENSYMYRKGHQEPYVCKGHGIVLAEAFFDNPTLWSDFLYTSKKKAERSMKIMQENTSRKYWNSSFRVIEIEVS